MWEMKDSGIEWIGEIGHEFKIYRLKYLCYILDEYRKPIAADKRVRVADTLYDYYGASGIIDKIDGYTIDDHVMLIGEDGANLILRNLPLMYEVNGRAWINNHAHILKPKEGMDFRFLFYALESSDLIPYITGSAQPKLNQEHLSNIQIAVPPYEIQCKISSFLDRKCAEIDALTADIETQIETLEQYKRSVITEAVTKGLDSDAEMKDSGAGWLGLIPMTWQTDKLKYHLKRNEPRNPGGKTVLSLYRELGVVPKDSRDDNHNVTSEDTSNYKYVQPGDFVVNKMKAWQGSVAVSEYEGIVSPAYFVYKFTDDEFNKRYFHYLMRGCYKDEFMRMSGGIRVGQWDLPSSALDNTLILIPPIAEQEAIADYLDDMCADIDDIITDKRVQQESLEEYKKSLIYEYVTGKKEVPNA